MSKGNVTAQRRARKARRIAAGLPREKGDIIAQSKRRRDRAKEHINNIKAAPCKDCGSKFPPVCMDFDHMPGHIKLKGVAKMWNMSIEAIDREISKCDLVCANCHRIRTAARRAESVETP